MADANDQGKWDKFKAAMQYDVSKAAKQSIKNTSSSLNQGAKTYTPTFHKGASSAAKGIGSVARFAGGALAGGGLKSQAAAGAALGGGMAAGRWGVNAGLNAARQAFPAGFWIFLAICMLFIDWVFVFGGIDAVDLVSFFSLSGFDMFRATVLTSAVMVILIAFFILNSMKQQDHTTSTKHVLFFVIAAAIIQVLLKNLDQYNIFAITGVEVLFLLLLIFGGASMLAFALVVLQLSIIVSFGGLQVDMVTHLLFALAFWWGLLRPKMNDNIRADITIAVFIFCDFFLFSILGHFMGQSIFANRFLFHMPILFTVIYTHEMVKSGLTKFAIGALILAYFIMFVGAAASSSNVDFSTQVTSAQKEQFIEEIKGIGEKSKEILTGATLGVQKGYNDTKNALNNDYYTAQTDSKAKEKLGLFLENLKTFDDSIYVDEPVLIDGRLRAKSIGRIIPIHSLSCYTKFKPKGSKVETIMQGKMDPLVDSTNPLTIFDEEIQFITCEIPENLPDEKWTPGSRKITVDADFDFATQSYLRTYYTNQQKLRDMIREEIDPYEQLGIPSKKGTAIYTSGPLELGIEARDALIGLDMEKENELPLSISFKNIWDGKLLEVYSLHVLLPRGMEIANDEGKETSCFGYAMRKSDCSSLGSVIDNVDEWCDNQEFVVYEYDDTIEGVKKIVHEDPKRGIKEYKTMRCKIDVDAAQILGDTGFAEEFTRVITGYKYRMEETISVKVKDLPDSIKSNVTGENK